MPETRYEPEPSLTPAQRDALLRDLDRDGYVVLPDKLPRWMLDEALTVIDRMTEERRMFEPDATYLNFMNIVERHPIFRRMMMYKPMLQLVHDAFGPLFILQQDQVGVKFPDPSRSDAGSVDWHCDGPETFPQVGGVVGMHTFRFGFLLTDATDEGAGSLEVVRGSHKRQVLFRRDSLEYRPFAGNRADADFSKDVVAMRHEAGTVVAFNSVIWHRAMLQHSTVTRKIVYIQFCPTWMRPLNRVEPTLAELQTYSPEERWLLGEPRPPADYIWPRPETTKRLSRFSREGA